MQHDFFCYILFQNLFSKLCWFHVYDYLPLGMIEQLNMLYRHGTGRHKGWKASLALLTYILCLITDLLCNYVNGTVGVLASSRVNILFMTILHALPKPFDRYSIWITKDRNRRRLISGIYPPVYQTVSPVTGIGERGETLATMSHLNRDYFPTKICLLYFRVFLLVPCCLFIVEIVTSSYMIITKCLIYWQTAQLF